MKALADIVSQGKALYIGLSNYPAERALQAQKLLKEFGVNVHHYTDFRRKKHYIPSIKPYLISNWLKTNENYGKLFFLHDADIIFKELPNFESLLNDDIYIESIQNLKEKIEKEIISEDSLTFNNLVGTIGEMKTNWLSPAKDTWLERYF